MVVGNGQVRPPGMEGLEARDCPEWTCNSQIIEVKEVKQFYYQPGQQHPITLKRAGRLGQRISLAAGVVTLCLLFALRDAPRAAVSA